MKTLSSLILIMLAIILLQSCEKSIKTADTQNQEDIQKNIDMYVDAFNHHKIDLLSMLWSQNGYYFNLSTEESAYGNVEIANYFTRLFDQKGAENLKITVSSIQFLTPNDAVAKGLMEISYQNHRTEKSAFSIQYIKTDGKWDITSFSVNEMNRSLSHFEQLKELDWLAGNWIDEDDNIDVKYTVEWDKNKNFLTQHFALSILGLEELSGRQIIGWDPVDKKIHSWIFDSDGGYGESVWSKEGNTWYESLTFTLPQGGKASATHIYQKIDDDTYTFASENRDVGGVLLPNIGPFKIIRN